MTGPELPPAPVCRCGVLVQHSWWHEVLENSDYRVVRVDTVTSTVDVLTIEVGDSRTAQPRFLTVAEVDWATLLDNFAEPVTTGNGEAEAMLAHNALHARLRELLSADGADGNEAARFAGDIADQFQTTERTERNRADSPHRLNSLNATGVTR